MSAAFYGFLFCLVVGAAGVWDMWTERRDKKRGDSE